MDYRLDKGLSLTVRDMRNADARAVSALLSMPALREADFSLRDDLSPKTISKNLAALKKSGGISLVGTIGNKGVARIIASKL